MIVPTNTFERSIDRQILLNRERSPTERLNALCDLLDVVRAMAPRGAAARERRRRSLAAHDRNREQLRAHIRRLLARGRADAAPGV